MEDDILQVGDLVQAVFRPDSIGVVERVYVDDGEKIMDVRRPQQPSWRGVPANAFVPVLACAKLYAIGAKNEGDIQIQRIVNDVAGLQVWMNNTPAYEVAAAYVCRLNLDLTQTSVWRAVSDILAEESARAAGIIL